ncbi:multiheme c-type cytochrome [Roseibacillus ishigakijimensis]|uniref:Cytochrome c-552/4 domain-containing protein n=1 Tax=Roseibacillus ishigakijimensis TaxID=454146 RepID=A0A934RPF3_9BACT|nr:multiheme c-type cytochrome [Roseibacillus ishigakijimensis]MBK1833068.1 hypothetical protein [Roseibacillus ishigakijimensis]
MSKPVLAAALTLFVLVGAGLAILVHFTREPARETPPLTVYFTCDTNGRLEPCGCFTGQLGGLTRAQSWLKKNRKKDSLLVDIGGALGGEQDYHVIQYRYLREAYRTMGYQALNLGASEARLPAQTLRTILAQAEVPLLSASLVDTATRAPLAPPSLVIDHQGRRIGLLGVLSPSSVPTPGEGLAILSLHDAISRHLPSLQAQCDEIILLAFAREDEMQQLAKDFYEFALIIGGDVRQASQKAQSVNQSLLVFTTNEARTVGQIAFRRKEGRLQEEAFDIHMLYPEVPQDSEIAALSAEFREYISTATLDIDAPERNDPNLIPGVTPTARYLGSQACAQCHLEETEIWQKSGHGHAFATLVQRDSQADPTCIGCHTVGFGEPSGYRRSFGAEKLVDVGCESCHGPGSAHVESWLAGEEPSFRFRPLGAGDCKTCHHGEFSRPFDWDTFWPQIAH